MPLPSPPTPRRGRDTQLADESRGGTAPAGRSITAGSRVSWPTAGGPSGNVAAAAAPLAQQFERRIGAHRVQLGDAPDRPIDEPAQLRGPTDSLDQLASAGVEPGRRHPIGRRAEAALRTQVGCRASGRGARPRGHVLPRLGGVQHVAPRRGRTGGQLRWLDHRARVLLGPGHPVHPPAARVALRLGFPRPGSAGSSAPVAATQCSAFLPAGGLTMPAM